MPVDCGCAADPRILRRDAGRGSHKATQHCTVGGGPCPVDGVPVPDSAGLPACVSALRFARGKKGRAEWLESCASEASVVFCFSCTVRELVHIERRSSMRVHTLKGACGRWMHFLMEITAKPGPHSLFVQ